MLRFRLCITYETLWWWQACVCILVSIIIKEENHPSIFYQVLCRDKLSVHCRATNIFTYLHSHLQPVQICISLQLYGTGTLHGQMLEVSKNFSTIVSTSFFLLIVGFWNPSIFNFNAKFRLFRMLFYKCRWWCPAVHCGNLWLRESKGKPLGS